MLMYSQCCHQARSLSSGTTKAEWISCTGFMCWQQMRVQKYDVVVGVHLLCSVFSLIVKGIWLMKSKAILQKYPSVNLFFWHLLL